MSILKRAEFKPNQKCHCNTLLAFNDEHTIDVGRFDFNSNCNTIEASCSALENSDLGNNIKCRLNYCRENDSADCFESDGANEKCGNPDISFKSVSVVDQKPTKRKNIQYRLDEQYYGEVRTFNKLRCLQLFSGTRNVYYQNR